MGTDRDHLRMRPGSMRIARPALAADPLAAVLGSLAGTLSVVSTVCLLVLGFAGGTVPLLGWTLPGGLLHGLTFTLLLAGFGVILLWLVPIGLARLAYTVLARFLPPTVAHRPGRASRTRRRAA